MTKLFLILLILSSLPEFVSASSRSEISFLSFCKEMSTYDLNEIPSSVIFAEAKIHGLDTELEQDKLNLESAVYRGRSEYRLKKLQRENEYRWKRLQGENSIDLPSDPVGYMAVECFESLLRTYLPAKYKRLEDRELENKRKVEAENKRIEREQQQQEAKIRQQKQIEEMETLKAQELQDAENREQLRMEREQQQEQERMERIDALKARQQAGSQVIEKREIEELERICVEDSELCDFRLGYYESRVLTESFFKIPEMPKDTEE